MKAAMRFLMVFLALAGAGTSAWADRGHIHFGVTVGPYWGPWYFPPPAYYYPPVVVERPTPPVIIQQPAPQIAAPTPYWYFCRPANAYYPYVKECPSGWERVPAQPPGQQ